MRLRLPCGRTQVGGWTGGCQRLISEACGVQSTARGSAGHPLSHPPGALRPRHLRPARGRHLQGSAGPPVCPRRRGLCSRRLFPREPLGRGPQHQLPGDAQLPGELMAAGTQSRLLSGAPSPGHGPPTRRTALVWGLASPRGHGRAASSSCPHARTQPLPLLRTPRGAVTAALPGPRPPAAHPAWARLHPWTPRGCLAAPEPEAHRGLTLVARPVPRDREVSLLAARPPDAHPLSPVLHVDRATPRPRAGPPGAISAGGRPPASESLWPRPCHTSYTPPARPQNCR